MEGQAAPLVVIAYDGSPAARQAVIDAAKFLRGSKVLVVTVWEEGLEYALEAQAMPADIGGVPPMADPQVAHEVDHALHTQAEGVSREGAELATSLGLEAEPLAQPDDEGSVDKTLLRLVDERNAAAVVVGSRGLSGLRARLEGSTSKAVLKHASCPVIVVHEAEHKHG